MNKYSIAAVIVLYNPTDNNIKEIANIKNAVDQIYVIDNSNDDIVRIKGNKKIKYIKENSNIGVAAALNKGARNAIKDNYKWLLTLDQDSEINSDIIEKMKLFLKEHDDGKIGIVSPYHDLKYGNISSKGDYEKVLEVMTSGNIINLDAFQKIGGFKDWLFIDDVDIEYCLNLNLNGYDIIRINYIKMKHNLGNMTIRKFFNKEVICSNHNAIRRYYMTRNSLYINDLYKEKYPDYCKFLLNCQKGQLKRVLVFEKNKIRKIRMMIKGYKDYKRGIKGKIK